MKEAEVRARITQALKDKFVQKLKEDGISQSDFFVSCIINYLGIQTAPKELKKDREDDKS